MPRVKTIFSKVYDVPRRPFEKERLDQVCILIVLNNILDLNRFLVVIKIQESVKRNSYGSF